MAPHGEEAMTSISPAPEKDVILTLAILMAVRMMESLMELKMREMSS